MSEYISLTIPFIIFFGLVASPGPATLAIMQTSMDHGRSSGLSFALGVISGSIFWGALAFLGISKIVLNNQNFFFLLKIIGSIYLFWLAYKSYLSAINNNKVSATKLDDVKSNLIFYVKGLLLHLTNPKAVLAWGTVLTLTFNSHNFSEKIAIISFLICSLIGILTFSVYAVFFSQKNIINIYQGYKKQISYIMVLIFLTAGFSLLFYSQVEIQPKISRHLAKLRECGVLIDRRQGQWSFYRINPGLPDWAKLILKQTTDANSAFLKKNLQNLYKMGDRPERVLACL